MKVDMKRKLNTGFTLLEVMIAVFVLAIGLLGIAALQMTGVKNNHTASMRTQATQLSYNLADRIRANIEGLENGAYTVNAAPGVNFNCGIASLGRTSFPGGGDTCTANEMAEADLDYWFTAANKALPLVTGVDNTDITCLPAPCSPGSMVTIKITWNEHDGVNGLVNKDFSMTFQR